MNPRVLAIDTTSEFGSIALVEGDRVLEEVALDSPEGFAHLVFPAIAALLARHGLELAQLDAFAGAAGPGSFTGVRVGLTAVKGLAEGVGRPAVGVSNLRALAGFGSRALRAPVVDARRGAVYGAVYDAALRRVREESVAPFREWMAALPDGAIELITNGCSLDEHAVTIPVVRAPRYLAGAVGRIAAAQLAGGPAAGSSAGDPGELDANYVRRADAELAWKDPAASREEEAMERPG